MDKNPHSNTAFLKESPALQAYQCFPDRLAGTEMRETQFK